MLHKTIHFVNLKKILSLFLASAVICIGSVDSQQTNVAIASIAVNVETNEIPKALTRKFKRDASRLALRMQATNEELRYQSIIIPPDNIENIYNILTNIYVKDERAKAIARCNIHTFPNPSIDHIVVMFERDVEWADPLREGVSETTSPEINELLDDYDLVIEKHVQWDDLRDAITIRSKEPLNMAAIANEFYNVEGVHEIDLGIPKISGNDININRIENGWEVQFVHIFGSYISGEGKVHIWKYNVLDNGEVEFVSESGAPLPEWMRCYFEGDPDKIMARG